MRMLHLSRAGSSDELAILSGVESFPCDEDGLGTALAGYDANRLALHNLHLRIDAGAGAIAETIANDLGEVTHELVVALETVGFQTNDRSVISHTDEQITAFGIQKCGDRFQYGVR